MYGDDLGIRSRWATDNRVVAGLNPTAAAWKLINDSLQHKHLPDMSKCLDNCAEVVSLEITLKNDKKSINMLHLSCTKI